MKKNTKFSLNFFNHKEILFVEDFFNYTKNIIQYAGYEATLTDKFDYDAVSIFYEYFTDDSLESLIELRMNGGRYIIVATEFVENNVFNGHIKRDVSSGWYGENDVWAIRFGNFVEAAAFAEEVWVTSGYQVDQYQTLLPNTPVKALPWGYDPYFLSTFHRTPETCDIDVLFTGSLTQHRGEMLMPIAKRFRVHLPNNGFAPDMLRRELLARSKLAIHLGLTAGAKYTSPMRHHYALMNGVAVVSERSQLPGELDDCVLLTTSETIIDTINTILTDKSWAEYGFSMRERYQTRHALDEPLRDLLSRWD